MPVVSRRCPQTKPRRVWVAGGNASVPLDENKHRERITVCPGLKCAATNDSRPDPSAEYECIMAEPAELSGLFAGRYQIRNKIGAEKLTLPRTTRKVSPPILSSQMPASSASSTLSAGTVYVPGPSSTVYPSNGSDVPRCYAPYRRGFRVYRC